MSISNTNKKNNNKEKPKSIMVDLYDCNPRFGTSERINFEFVKNYEDTEKIYDRAKEIYKVKEYIYDGNYEEYKEYFLQFHFPDEKICIKCYKKRK